jgi:hypothetical protein
MGSVVVIISNIVAYDDVSITPEEIHSLIIADSQAQDEDTTNNAGQEIKDEHKMVEIVEHEDARAPVEGNMIGDEAVLSQDVAQINDAIEN